MEKELNQFYITEKLDGSGFSLTFSAGDWWTSRGDGVNYHRSDSVEPWGDSIWKSSFRNAHNFLKIILADAPPTRGQYILGCEILSSRYPNALTYHDYDSYENTLVFYHLPDGLEDSIKVRLQDVKLSFPVIEKTVGEDLQVTEKWVLEKWKVVVAKPLDSKDLKAIFTSDQYPADKCRSAIDYVSTIKSAYGDTRVEGLVLTHDPHGWSTKLVDSDWFLPMTAANYGLRSQMFRTPRRYSDSIGDQHARLLNTTSQDEADGIALLKTMMLYHNYLDDQSRFLLPRHVQARNLESILSSLESYGWQGF